VNKERTIDKRNYKLVIFSLLFLNLFNWISIVEGIYGIPKVVKYSLSVGVLSIIIYYRFANPTKPSTGRLFYPIIIVFFLWSLVLLVSTAIKFNNLFYLQRALGQPLFFIPYIIPMFILYSKYDLKFFSYFFKYSFIFIIPAILIQLYIIATGIASDDWEEQNNRMLLFDIGSKFLLLTSQFSRKRYVFGVALIYNLLTIYLFAHYGSRGILMDYIILLLFMIVFRLRSPFLEFADRMRIYFAGLIVIILVMAFGYLATSSYVFQRGFSKDAFEESRSVVFQDFFLDFSSTTDWVIGRGLDGTVFRSLNIDEERAGYIENGFLTVTLKGGLLYLIPFILILLRASYLGFFRSNNDMVKAMAALLLIYVMMMIHFNLPAYTTRYVFIWIATSTCFTPVLRNYSNEEIYQAMNGDLN
jgi:hypothetical protein